MPPSGGTTIFNYNFGSGIFKPPVPSQDPTGDIVSGYSNRFKTHLTVADRDGNPGLSDEQTKYDVAFLQLQLQEVLEINKRKEDELQTKNTEIEGLYKRLRDYLIIQDQLYKDYVRAEALTTKMKEEMNQKIRNATDNWHEEEMKVEKLQRLVQELRANLPE